MKSVTKRGRSQLEEGQLGAAQRRVRIDQLDWDLLASCYRKDTGDDQATIFEGTGKLSSMAVSHILERYIFLCSEDSEEGEKRRRQPPDVAEEEPEADALVSDPVFQHSVVKCGVNSYKDLRTSHASLTAALPDYKQIWKAKSREVSEELLPLLEVHGMGFELDPQRMMCLAVDTFGLWDEKMITFRFSYDTAAIGATVFGFSIIHPSAPTSTNLAFFPVAIWRGPENAHFLRQQAPKTVELIESYAKDATLDKNGGFSVLHRDHPELRYQLFLNPDMKAVTDSTCITGCLICPFTWQGVRSAKKPEAASWHAYAEAYAHGAALVEQEEISEGKTVYMYTVGSSKTPVFVVHDTLEEGERMTNPLWLPSRDLNDLLESVNGSLRVRVWMIVPDFMLHGIKRLVEKLIRGCLDQLMITKLSDTEKMRILSDFMRETADVCEQRANLNLTSWLDEKIKEQGVYH